MNAKQEHAKPMPHGIHAGVIALPAERIPSHKFYDNRKFTSKCKAGSHHQEFLQNVFSADSSSRFFKMFLLRFMFDSNSSDESASTLLLA